MTIPEIDKMSSEEQVKYLLNQIIDMDCAIIGYREGLAYESADDLVNELERMVKDVLGSFRKADKK